MSDEHNHDDDAGAHEIDKPPNARLFNILFGLSALTFVACVGVVQMFNLQVDSIESERAKKGSPILRDYKDEEAAIGAGFGRYEAGVLEENKSAGYYVPLTKARKELLDNAELLRGIAPGPEFKDSGVAKQINDWGGMPKPPAPAAADAKAPADPAGAKPTGRGN